MDLLSRLNENLLPFAKFLGLRFVAAELDRVVAELPVRPELCTRPAVAHGGAIIGLADPDLHRDRPPGGPGHADPAGPARQALTPTGGSIPCAS